MTKLTTKKSAPAVVTTRAKTLSPKDRLAVQRAAEIAAEEARVASRGKAKRAAAPLKPGQSMTASAIHGRAWRAQQKAARLAAQAAPAKTQPAPVATAPAKVQPTAQQPAHKAQPQQSAQLPLDLGVTLSQAQGALAVQLAAARKRAQDEGADPRQAGIAEGLRIAQRILDLVR